MIGTRETAIDLEDGVHACYYRYTPELTERGRNQSNGGRGVSSGSGGWGQNGGINGVSQVEKGNAGARDLGAGVEPVWIRLP